MSGSVNKAIILGRLGADPEVRRTQDGRAIVNLRVATSETWRDKQSGEKREKTEWHSVVIFNEALAKVAEQYLSKGSQVYLEGQIQTRSWEDQSGQKRYSTEIVLQSFGGALTLLGDLPDRGDAAPARPRHDPVAAGMEAQRPSDRKPAPSRQPAFAASEMDDEIPF